MVVNRCLTTIAHFCIFALRIPHSIRNLQDIAYVGMSDNLLRAAHLLTNQVVSTFRLAADY